MLRGSLLASLVLVSLALPVEAQRRLTVRGPTTVRVGQEVRFPTTGFKPHERIEVSLAPRINRGGNCCGITVIKRARADARGKAILHWRWPAHYFNGNERRRWRHGSRADVLVYTPAMVRGRRTVRVLTR